MKKLDIDGIDVSSKLDDFILKGIKEGYKTKETKKKNYKKVIGLAITIIVVFGFSNSKFVNASIEKIKNSLGNFAIDKQFTVDEKDKMQIGETIEDKKIKVTLDECYIDNGRIMFTTTLDSRGRCDYAQEINPQVYINNQLMDVFENDYSGDIIHNEDKTVSLLSSFSLDGIDTSKDLDVVIDYNEIGVTNIFDVTRQIKGKWKFSFIIDSSKVDTDSITREINKSIIIDDYELFVKEIKIMPYRIELITNSVKLKDNPHSFPVHYIIKDDHGNEYIDDDGKGRNGTMELRYLIDTRDIKSLTIVPRTDFYNSEPTIHYDKGIQVDIR